MIMTHVRRGNDLRFWRTFEEGWIGEYENLTERMKGGSPNLLLFPNLKERYYPFDKRAGEKRIAFKTAQDSCWNQRNRQAPFGLHK